MTDQGCHGVRELLGVYVVGAIDPADRALADAHLPTCPRCREELSALAGLPALLRRVPIERAEALAAPGSSPVPQDPSPQLLPALLAEVARRRSRRRTRTFLALVAAVMVAAGGGALVARTLGPGAPASVTEVARAVSGQYAAEVRYVEGGPASLTVRVSGVPAGTTCDFWIVTKDGRRLRSGRWTVYPGSEQMSYSEPSLVASGQLAAFVVTAGGRDLIRVPAS